MNYHQIFAIKKYGSQSKLEWSIRALYNRYQVYNESFAIMNDALPLLTIDCNYNSVGQHLSSYYTPLSSTWLVPPNEDKTFKLTMELHTVKSHLICSG